MDSIQEDGIVVKTHEETATVQISKSASCAHCKAGCMEKDGTRLAEAENSAGAGIGDTVRLRFDPGAALRATLIVFGLPLLALFIGVILTTLVTSSMNYQGNAELMSIAVGAALFFLTFIPVKLYDRRVRKSGSLNIAIVEILKKADS